LNKKLISDITLDIIIPVRSRSEYDICERLIIRCKYELPKGFQFLVVDYGSNVAESKKIKEICNKNGFVYLFVDARNQIWNASKARNAALLYSTADYVMFEDVDLISGFDFYYKIQKQIYSLLINKKWPFFAVPVAYLTEDCSDELQSPLDELEYEDFVTEIFDAKNSEKIEFYAPTSSLLICRRDKALFVGGYDQEFEGWGFEDSDFWIKLLRDIDIEKPKEFYKLDTRPYNNQVEWRGWRALFRLFADVCAQKGIYSFHKWHPIAEHRSDFIRAKNHKIFLKNCDYYSKNKYALTPLWNPDKKTTLFLSKNPHSFNEYIFKHFTNPLLIEEKDFILNDIDKIIEKYNLEEIVFNNPYGNPKRLAIYQAFRERDIKCFVVERGALPWSIYIDNGGFCAESKSYLDFLNHDLNEENYLNTLEYIENLKTIGAALEPQSNMIGGINLKREIFGSTKGYKVLFIAFQSPSDTTTNYFCGQIETYTNFVNQTMMLPVLLEGTEWKVIYKNHPLSLSKVEIPGAINVDNYHIGDILDACDGVTLINSGVGVLSVAYGKPVYCFGQAFYQQEPLSFNVSDANELVKLITDDSQKYDKALAMKFISFLINDFYSFASWEREEREHTKDAKLSISKNIKYTTLRVWDDQKSYYYDNQVLIDLKSSHLFDRYRLEDYLSRNNKDKINVKQIVRKEEALDKNIIKPNIKKNKIQENTKNSLVRKAKKLIRDPNLFFLDLLSKRK